MRTYSLIEQADYRPHGLYKTIIGVSTNKNLIFKKATKLARKELDNKSSWRDNVYWVYISDSKTGKIIDKLEFDSNGRREGTFGKIVRERGSRDEKVVGTWYK